MKKILLNVFVLLMGCAFFASGQGKLEVFIVQTGGVEVDTIYVEDDDEVIIDTVVVEYPLSSDDAEQENDEVDTPYDDDLDAGWEGEEGDRNILTVGLRFQDITIPNGATIDSAFIIVHSHEGKFADDVANITIYGEATDSSFTFDEENFNNDYLITDRPATEAKVRWVVEEDWSIWAPYSTPDIKTIVQEIVNREGWKSGNALSIILSGEDQGPSDVENAREFEAFENISDPSDKDEQDNPGDGQNHPERVPKLVVYYDGYTSVTNKVVNDQLYAYPNPVTNGYFSLKGELNETLAVDIFDITGKKMKSFNSYKMNDRINIHDLTKGIYFVRASASAMNYTLKFIVK